MPFLLIIAILAASEMVYFKVAAKYGIIDRPNERSSHHRETIRGGGIVFLFGAWLYALFFGMDYPWFMIGLSALGVVSFMDDIHSLPDSVRLVFQFAAMGLMFYQFGIIHWDLWWMIILSLIVCVGIINAFNFMDGINGMTGAYSLAVLLPLMYLNRSVEAVPMSLLAVATISVLVFCFFNFRGQAVCFAGDIGALSVAFILMFAVGMLILRMMDFSYIGLLAVYGVDAILTIVHRIMLHENLGKAHRKHAYQIMANELRIPHVKVSALYFVIQMAISFGLIYTTLNHYVYLLIVTGLLSVAYICFMRRYYCLHEVYLKTLQSNG